jgi:hypothetical protein
MTIWGSMSRMACTRQSASEHSAGLGHIVIAGASANPKECHASTFTCDHRNLQNYIDELQHYIDQSTMSPYKHDQRLIRLRKFIHGKDKL